MFALNGLGLLDQGGLAVTQSHIKTMEYFLKAVDIYYADGCNSTGDIYKYGYSVDVDYKEVFRWYL
jgi:TPR repeat protein